MKVSHKKTKKVFQVYDVLFQIVDHGKHDGSGESVSFLIYKDGKWEYCDAQDFEPMAV